MNIMDGIFAKAKAAQKTIVLPEGSDIRVVKAAQEIVARGLAKIVIIGKKNEVDKAIAELGADMSKVTCIDPAASPKLDDTQIFSLNSESLKE